MTGENIQLESWSAGKVMAFSYLSSIFRCYIPAHRQHGAKDTVGVCVCVGPGLVCLGGQCPPQNFSCILLRVKSWQADQGTESVPLWIFLLHSDWPVKSKTQTVTSSCVTPVMVLKIISKSSWCVQNKKLSRLPEIGKKKSQHNYCWNVYVIAYLVWLDSKFDLGNIISMLVK